MNHAGQLFRDFHVTEARFGVLTNGIRYRFFTDLERPNRMDDKPFFEFNILDFKDRDVEELKKFAKSSYDLDTILATATELKYTRAIQWKLNEWTSSPSEEFVRLVAVDLLNGRRFTPAIRDQFSQLTQRAFEQLIGERINERLKGAMTPETITSVPRLDPRTTPPTPPQDSEPAADARVVTSPEEVEGFHIVRAIVREVVETRRVVMRDAQSYCAILLDDNNRRPICRLRFNNTSRLRLGLFGETKEEEIVDVDSPDSIYAFADRLRATVRTYLGNEA